MAKPHHSDLGTGTPQVWVLKAQVFSFHAGGALKPEVAGKSMRAVVEEALLLVVQKLSVVYPKYCPETLILDLHAC